MERLETVFLGITDLLSGERTEAKDQERERELERKMDMSDHFKRPGWEHFRPCHFNLGLDGVSQSR